MPTTCVTRPLQSVTTRTLAEQLNTLFPSRDSPLNHT